MRSLVALLIFGGTILPLLAANDLRPHLLSSEIDVSADFYDPANNVFCADTLTTFDPATGRGQLKWKRTLYTPHMSFNNMVANYDPTKPNEWPKTIYAADPDLPFSVEFVSPTTIRLRLKTTATAMPEPASLMLVKNPGRDPSCTTEKIEGGWLIKSPAGSVTVREKPWRVEIRDASGRLLTQTLSDRGELPVAFVRRTADYSRSVATAFSLAPDEKLFGCGESFTPFNKHGQKVVLWTRDSLGVESQRAYKPVPFFLSSRGYGMFIHTSSPITCDFGATVASRNVIMAGDDELDLFILLGTPKEILGAYTELTGRSPLPPLWTFGLWMSRITYKSEAEVRDVAAKLRANKIPSDVIHLDTGWFETDWQCDYEFSKTRFADPKKMIDDLRGDGFRISLWQLPYFVPQNKYFPEIVAQGLAVHDAKGGLPTEDAVLDFSNPATVTWYQEKIAGLLKLGVGAIKVDFGEAAPVNGVYASGRTGFYEHNLYPLRYQQAAAEITQRTTGDNIIWARASWAGSQRYPIHWGGDSHNTDSAMAGTLRGGLSFGLSGFSFWSHDIGGFFGKTPRELYRRWMPFGMLTSHSRTHGQPPKEPWAFDDAFMDDFRRADELKYRLMPYVYAQAKDCSDRGLPMVRALFVEFPDDPGAWLVDDEYLFGSSLLVAPLFEANTTARNVYLPAGRWIDYQTGQRYEGGWHHIEAGTIPVVVLVRDGTILPHAALAQSTRDIDWSHLELAIYATEGQPASGLIYLPGEKSAQPLKVSKHGASYALDADPLAGKVTWSLKEVK